MKWRELALVPLFLAMPLALNSVAVFSFPIYMAFSVFRTHVGKPIERYLADQKRKALAPRIVEKDFNAIVIGGGFSGINAAYELSQRGIPHLVFEKSEQIGGTWWDNKYPGCACDVPAHLYSYSFAPNPNWSRQYARAKEIQQYLDSVLDKFNLRENFRTGTEVVSANWDEGSKKWNVTTSKGKFTCSVLISGIGALNVPLYPEVEGMRQNGESVFRGASVHTARWDDSFDFNGKNIAVIGSAASAVQAVPALAAAAKNLFIFQRTPNYITERGDFEPSEIRKKIFRNFPSVHYAYRCFLYIRAETLFVLLFRGKTFFGWLARRGFEFIVRRKVTKKGVAEKLVPDYSMGCKRILATSDYLPALQRENVTLVTAGVQKISPEGPVANGKVFPVDAIVYATGFSVFSMLNLNINGHSGESIAEKGTDLSALNGVTVNGFPNLFLLLGPNTGLGHNSIVFMIECQVNYTMKCIETLLRNSDKNPKMEPTVSAVANFDDFIQRNITGRIWTTGCKSWYQNKNGRIFTLWPNATYAYWWKTLFLNLEDYSF